MSYATAALGLGGRGPTARDLQTATCSLVALLDVDDFVVTRLARGDAWATAEIARVGLVVEAAGARDAVVASVRHVEPDEWIFLLQGADADALREAGRRLAHGLRGAVEAETQCTATVSLGTVHHAVDQVERSLSEAAAANQRKLVLGGNRVIEGEPEGEGPSVPPAPERIEQELSQRLHCGDRDGALALLKAWVARSAELEGVTPEMLRSWLAAEVLFAMNVVEKRRLSDGSMDWVEVFGRTSFDELLAIASIHEQSYLVLWLERLFGRITDTTAVRQRPGRHILALVEAHIEEHYAEDLTLAKVARAVHVSPFYISHLFHRELDTTFLKYLTATRMARARRLLLETNLPVATICAQVGYASPKSFRSVFKRTVGLTPTEFRAGVMAEPA